MASFTTSTSGYTPTCASPASLLISTSLDSASTIIAEALKEGGQLERVPGTDAHIYCSGKSAAQPFILWCQDQSLLKLNHADKLFADVFPGRLEDGAISDIMFLSRHAAESGRPSLTVHPIGVPWMADPGRMGGLPGRVSPPSPRIGALYRTLREKTGASALKDEFEVTLEATHHGPHVDVPACFVEIGSTSAEWGRHDAGRLWREVLAEHYATPRSEMQELATTAVVLIGGGHYCPKMGDLARTGPAVVCGHALASYAFQAYMDGADSGTEVENAVEGGWKHILREALEGTRLSFPHLKLLAVVDKKMKSVYRGLVVDYLETEGYEWTYKVKSSDIASLPVASKDSLVQI